MAEPETPGEGLPELAWDIMDYVLRNPEAVDDLRGIVRWRLLDQIIMREMENASKALEWLVEQDYLVRTDSPAAGELYQLNRPKETEARAFLVSRKERRSR